MDPHREVAERIGTALADRDDVLAVLLTGSVARGEHTPTSDVDLAVVTSDNASLEGARELIDGLLVEYGVFSEARWRARFDRPKTSWLYTFLEAQVVMDTGPAARLVRDAQKLLETYRTSAELRETLATFLWHCQAKLDRAQATADDLELGFLAAFCAPAVLDGLYAVHDVPLPYGARRLAYLHLVPLPRNDDALVQQMLTGDPPDRLEATRLLVSRLRRALGPADHERDEPLAHRSWQ